MATARSHHLALPTRGVVTERIAVEDCGVLRLCWKRHLREPCWLGSPSTWVDEHFRRIPARIHRREQTMTGAPNLDEERIVAARLCYSVSRPPTCTPNPVPQHKHWLLCRRQVPIMAPR